MRRFMMLVLTMTPALEAKRPVFSGVAIEPTWACETVAGTGGFEWQEGGTVCWLALPGWYAF